MLLGKLDEQLRGSVLVGKNVIHLHLAISWSLLI